MDQNGVFIEGGQNGVKMDQNGSKWTKMGSKWGQKSRYKGFFIVFGVKRGSKWGQNGGGLKFDWSRTVKS